MNGEVYIITTFEIGAMDDKDLFYTLALLKVEGIRDIIAKRLLSHFGSAEKIFKASKNELLSVDGIGKILCEKFRNKAVFKTAESEIKFIRDHEISVAFYKDTEYPDHLKYCNDGPVLLFSKGAIRLQRSKVISIVGTRQLTGHGAEFCRKLIAELTPWNPIIVSGFAYGTDITAQLAAIENKLQTIAVLAHGLNRMYPASHLKFRDHVVKNGGFLTEFWSTTKPEKEHFIRRNRIIAGMSEATIVIESAEKGGALITAYMADGYNRDVFAVPGRTTDKFSIGCHTLLKTQRAHLLTEAADLVYVLNWDRSVEVGKSIQKQLFVTLEPDEQILYNFLDQNGKELLDMIALNCGFPVHKVARLLMAMELKGAIRSLPGKVFEIL